MCDYGSYLLKGEREKSFAQGFAQGHVEGHAEGVKKATITLLRNVMKNMNVSADKSMELLGVSSADRAKYKALLSK